MRIIKAIPLLALAALAAAALSVPAVASAELKWTSEGQPLQEPANIGLNDGSFHMQFGSGGSEVECPVSGGATLAADSGAGEVTSYDIEVPGCQTRGFATGGLGQCEVTDASSDPFPFQLQTAESVSVDDIAFTLEFGQREGFETCYITKIEFFDGEHTEMEGDLGFDQGGFLTSLDLSSGPLDYLAYYGGYPYILGHGGFSATPLTITPAETYYVEDW
jgi:hypothetical protein